jgi:hypothetical protein
MGTHALLSPSGAHRWRSCTASPGQSVGKPSTSSEAAMQGTAEHQVSEECLLNGGSPESYIGRTLLFWRNGDTQGETWDTEQDEHAFRDAGVTVYHDVTIDEASAARCAAYVQFVRDLVAAKNATLFVEQRLPIDHITGEADAKGTSDSVLVTEDEIIIADAKFGRSKVMAYGVVKPAVFNADGVEIEPAVLDPNDQLAMYADGALREFGWLAEFKRVRMIIVQPAIGHVSEFAYSVEQHNAFIERVRQDAESTRTNPTFNPTPDNCYFCPGRFDCAARNERALTIAAGAFEDPDALVQAVEQAPADRKLGTLYSNLPFIKRWAEDIETRVRETLEAGLPVVRADGMQYGFEPGRQGAREWVDDKAAEELLSKMRLGDDMYVKKVISPTVAEKLTKVPKNAPEGTAPRLGPRQWNKLAAQITRADGKPQVVLLTSAPPVIDSSTDLF